MSTGQFWLLLDRGLPPDPLLSYSTEIHAYSIVHFCNETFFVARRGLVSLARAGIRYDPTMISATIRKVWTLARQQACNLPTFHSLRFTE